MFKSDFAQRAGSKGKQFDSLSQVNKNTTHTHYCMSKQVANTSPLKLNFAVLPNSPDKMNCVTYHSYKKWIMMEDVSSVLAQLSHVP